MEHTTPALSSNLTLIERLGDGAMGEVWRAHSRTLDASVAVKLLRRLDSPQLHQRFAREARGAARIHSPHVVRIFDFGISDEGVPYIVMEWLQGHDLQSRLERSGPLSPQQTCAIIDQACLAVEAAHAIEVIHRDIKPANLFLVDSAGEPFVKLVDFGIAKQPDGHEITMTGALMGTPHYMSPEQLSQPRDVDHRSDLWSLAVVAYVCLTGRVPFDGETVAGIALAIHHRRVASPRLHRAELPAALDGWFAQAFHPDLSQRFQSARELARELRRALLEQPVTLRVATPAPARQRLWALAAVFAGLASLSAVGAYALVRSLGAAPVPPAPEDGDPEMVLGPPISNYEAFDVMGFVAPALDWAQRRDPDAALTMLTARSVRPNGTADISTFGEGTIFYEVLTPRDDRCFHFSVNASGSYVTAVGCVNRLRANGPRCTLADVLKRGYRGAPPPEAFDVTYQARPGDIDVWQLSDDSGVDVTVYDECR